jgi:hypothetical protein
VGAIGLVSLASLPTLRELAGISGGCQSVTLSRRISPGQVQQFATDGQRADSRSSIRSAVSMPASGRREALRGAGITIAIQHVARRTSATSQSDATGSLSAPGRKSAPPGNPSVDFHGEQRKNQTHASTTDPDRCWRAKAWQRGQAQLQRQSVGGESPIT